MPSVYKRFLTAEKPSSVPTVHSHTALTQAEAHERRSPVILMVSGGADSTALLVLAATSALDIDDGRGKARIARERLHVLHINHMLRGEDAFEDERFVCALARRYGIPCTVRRIDVEGLARKAATRDTNIENIGREERYRAARELAFELSREFGTPRSAARILTAHTADDRAETFVMNAIRGSGPAGLSSIPRRRNMVVRPLLDKTHAELCELLRMRGQTWREDHTNADIHYLRAYVRHEVLPLLKARNVRLSTSLSTSCDILADEDAYMGQVAARALRDLVRRSSETMLALDARKLGALDVAIARRVVRRAVLSVCPSSRLEARHINTVLQLVAAGKGSTHVPISCDVRVEYGLLFIRQASKAVHDLGLWLEVPGKIELPDGRQLAARLTHVPQGARAPELALAHAVEWSGESVLLDALASGLDSAAGGRLWVDAAAPGDVMCPLGMHGQSKKLSDLLNEARIPAADRATVPVIRSSVDGAVIWVAGIRPDERVRCEPDTKLLLELSISGG